jgi:hypothetical protein
LPRRARDQVRAADHSCHLLEGVVDHHRELITREPVAPLDDDVAAGSEVVRLSALEQIVELARVCR